MADKTSKEDIVNLNKETSALEKVRDLKSEISDMMIKQRELRNESLQSEKSLAAKYQAQLDINTKIADNERDLALLGNETLKRMTREEQLSSSILSSEQALYDASNKQKLIHNENYQTGLLNAKIKNGIVDTEEEILNIIREKKKLEDPAYKQKTKELELLKKKVDREKEIEEWTTKWTDKWDDFNEIIQDPKVAGGLFMIAMANEAGKFADTLETAADNMGMSKTQGYELGNEMLSANLMGAAFGISAKQNADAMAGLAEGAGDLNDLSGKAVVQVANLARNIGLGEKEAGKLVGHMSLVEGMTVKQSKATLETTANLARGAKLPIGKVMSDVAENMELTSKFGNISVEQLGKMAVEAGKLGATLGQMSALGDKLLDIDTARASAMELSVMLGRQVNVDKAQQLMYEGKIEEGYKEMLNQLGGIQGFNQMDYYQKKQTAELMGLTTGELEKQLNKAAGLTETGEKHASGWAKVGEATSRYGGYLKDNAVTLAATANLMGSMVKNVGAFAPALKGLGGKITGKLKDTKIGKFLGHGKGKDLKSKMTDPEKPLGDADKMGKGGKKGGIKNKMKDLAAGFKALGKGGVLKGILALALAGPALLLALPSIPFLLFMGVVPLAMLATNFKFLAQGLKSLGKGFSSILKGLLVLGLLGVAMIPAALAFHLLEGVDPLAMLAFSGAIVLLGLAAAGLGFIFPMVMAGALALAVLGVAIIPAALAFGKLEGVDPKVMIGFGVSLVAIATAVAGMGIMLPAILYGIAGMFAISAVLPFYSNALAKIPTDLDLLGFAAGTTALGLAGMTLIPGALGFVMMAGALTLFAYSLLLLVPLMPVLDKLGSIGVIGGKKEGGEAEAESAAGGDNSEIIEKLDELITTIKSGGKVIMDGKEVGKVVQLATGPIGS